MKSIVAPFLERSDSELDFHMEIIDQLKQHISPLAKKTEHQDLFMRLLDQFGESDMGTIFVFFCNILNLTKGEWISIEAGVPHCYIRGQLMENMINSDNVVRAGLTSKLKDTATLLKILDFREGNFAKRQPMNLNDSGSLKCYSE